MITKAEAEILAGKTGFLKTQVEKIYRMMALLEEIARHPLLSSRLALKGGTAIQHVFFQYPRLSVDLDFDYTVAAKKEDLDDHVRDTALALESLFRFFRYPYRQKLLQGHLQYFASYATHFGGSDAVKVEINFLLRQSLDKPARQAVRSPFPFRFRVLTLSIEEVYAAKCVALFTRLAPRDLFDIYYLTLQPDAPCNLEKFKTLFYFYAAISKVRFHEFHIRHIQEITDREIKNHLWPLLTPGDRRSRSVMLKGIMPLIKKLMTPDERQKRFFKLFYSRRPDFTLLFNDARIAQRALQHPMVLWRQQQLLNHKT